MQMARLTLLKIISSLKFLAIQGLAIRGHSDETSNFINLLKLRTAVSLELDQWLKKDSYR